MAQTRILITGSRSWHCPTLARSILGRLSARYSADLAIVHGACPTGVDAAFDAACGELGIAVERHPADWDNVDHPGAVEVQDWRGRVYDQNAGPARNSRMVSLGAAFAIALHKQIAWSKGTADCARKCLRAGIDVWLVDNDDGVVRRLTEGDLRR